MIGINDSCLIIVCVCETTPEQIILWVHGIQVVFCWNSEGLEPANLSTWEDRSEIILTTQNTLKAHITIMSTCMEGWHCAWVTGQWF